MEIESQQWKAQQLEDELEVKRREGDEQVIAYAAKEAALQAQLTEATVQLEAAQVRELFSSTGHF